MAYYRAARCDSAVMFAPKRGKCPAALYELTELDDAIKGFRGIKPGRPVLATEDLGQGMSDYSDEPNVPEPLVVPIVNARSTTPGKYKEFEERKAKGEIVIKPMDAIEAKAIVYPVVGGVVTSKAELRPTVRFPKTIEDRFNPCTGGINTAAGWINTALGDQNKVVIPLSDEYYGLGSSFRLTKVWDVIQNPLFEPPSPGIAHSIHAAVLTELSYLGRDTGLITSSIAEANSGIYDLLTELGEAKETISYIFGFFRSIIELSIKAKKAAMKAGSRPGSSAKDIADEVASIWMQYRYAVSPLVYSANDALDLISSIYSPYQTFRKGTERTITPNLDGWSIPALKVIDRCWVKYQYSADMKLHGVKMNLLSTAWELTPLSFVLGWVINVGDFLSALQMPSNVHQRAVQYSRQIRPQTIECVGPEGQRVSYTLRYYNATPINPLGQIGLNIDPSMTWKRWFDAIALSWGMSKSLLRG